MELKVIKEYKAELVEIDELQEHGPPVHYQEPYYVVMTGKNVVAKFYFLTKKDFTRDNGKRIYLSMDFSVAQRFDSFQRAIEVAFRFKTNDQSGIEKYYVIGSLEAKIVEMYIKQEREKFYKLFPEKFKNKFG